MTVTNLMMYVLGAMMTWVPLAEHAPEDVEVTGARYYAVAKSISEVALDENEAPLFPGEDGRARTALLLASIASLESTYTRLIVEGSALGDHGAAWCMMQVHPSGGIVLIGDSYDYVKHRDQAWLLEHKEDVVTGWDLARDKNTCVRTALHMARDSMRKTDGTLRFYTGEQSGKSPKARYRLERAERYWTRHPL